jgi:Rad3-related DNA helicase
VTRFLEALKELQKSVPPAIVREEHPVASRTSDAQPVTEASESGIKDIPTETQSRLRNLRALFPLKEPRQTQVYVLECLQKILSDDKYKFVVIDAPTGVGKTAINATIAALGNSITSTSGLNLMNQYINDFPNRYTELRGKANYACYEQPGKKCDNSKCTSGQKKDCYGCAYGEAKRAATSSRNVITNHHCLLSLTKANWLKEKKGIDYLILDEAHRLPEIATSVFSVELDPRMLKTFSFPDKIPEGSDWEPHVAFLNVLRNETGKSLEANASSDDLIAFAKRINDSILGLNLNDPGNVAITREEDPLTGELRVIRYAPINISEMMHRQVWSQVGKVVLSSATILDVNTFMSLSGLKLENTAYIRLPSEFPVEYGRVYYNQNVGILNKGNLVKKLPEIAEKVIQILRHHADHKGIIHTHTYLIGNALEKYLNEHADLKSRLLYAKDAKEQASVLERHYSDPKPTVLMSPSLTEGIDLKDDLARFQIMVRVPYPYYGDPLLTKRMELYPNYANMLTAMTLEQMRGRALRTPTDWAIAYMLDGNFTNFVNYNKNILSDHFLKSIVW